MLDDFTVNLSFATRTHQRKKAWELLPHTFANILPGLAALVVALFLSVLLAWILATIVRRILAGLHFDERLGRWGFASSADWLPMNSPTRLVSRSIAALVIVSGFLIGISAFDFQWTSLFVQNVFAYIPAVMAALVVLLFGNVVARFLARSVLIQYARFLSIGVKWIVIVLSVARPTASQSRGLMKAGADGARQR